MPPKDVINDLTVTEELCSSFSPPPPVYLLHVYRYNITIIVHKSSFG